MRCFLPKTIESRLGILFSPGVDSSSQRNVTISANVYEKTFLWRARNKILISPPPPHNCSTLSFPWLFPLLQQAHADVREGILQPQKFISLSSLAFHCIINSGGSRIPRDNSPLLISTLSVAPLLSAPSQSSRALPVSSPLPRTHTLT